VSREPQISHLTYAFILWYLQLEVSGCHENGRKLVVGNPERVRWDTDRDTITIDLLENIGLVFCVFRSGLLFARKEQKKKKKLHVLSPRANYTDRATAASRRSVANLCG
jgi:hypothetical protein